MLLAVLAARPRRQLQFARLTHADDGCKDERPDCAGWAADGECEANAGYMMASCTHSCTRCGEGPSGVGVLRSKKERASRRDTACDNLDEDCEARVAAGACHDGSDAPLRCPAGCRICRFPEVAKEAYGCSGGGLLLPWAAQRCERQRLRCARPQHTPPLVGPGDIDATMRRILTAFPEYRPRAISRPGDAAGGGAAGGGAAGDGAPWIITLQDFLSEDEVAAFIDGCARQFSRSMAGDVLSPVRTSSQCWCSHNDCERNPLTHLVARRIANVTRTPSERYMEPFQILKYEAGQFYRAHHDQNSGLFTPQGARVYTFFMYLSTPEVGGGTHFTDLNLTVPAVKGSAVLWPSVTSDDPDIDEPLTHHEGLPPDSGLKFASNVWIHNFDFRTPADAGCPLCHKNTH